MKPARALILAAISILLWATLATIGLKLSHVPPFLLVGLTLGFGCLPAVPQYRRWFPNRWILLFGTAGIFGYHFFLFLAFRMAPAVEANLINYLWPVLIVLLSSLLLPDHRLNPRHIVGAILAFSGAALVLTGGNLGFRPEYLSGYLLALAAAAIWSGYSVLTKRIGTFPTAAVAGFCLLSSILSLGCHFALEPSTALTASDWILLVSLGIGPMGIAFYAWDASLKQGDPRVIGALSYFTPLLSTTLLSFFGTENKLRQSTWIALVLIVGGAAVSSIGGSRSRSK